MFTRNFSIAAAALTLLGLASMSAVADEKATQQVQQMQQVTIDQQAATARTRADHEAVAKRFEDEAADLDKQAGKHERLAKQYHSGVGVGPKTNALSLANHCDTFVKDLRAAAKDAREMAQMHRDIAKSLTN